MDNVKVAVRVRPLGSKELEQGCRPCIERTSNKSQISVGKNKTLFTFNYVFDELDDQNIIYERCAKHLINKLFSGYNVTILAYGQTGSGKTFTMGTNYITGEEQFGIIPRAVQDIFAEVNYKKEIDGIEIDVSFLELYNENLYDLLSHNSREDSIVELRDYGNGNGVTVNGLTHMRVSTFEKTMEVIQFGSVKRVVGSTAMNDQSSRSHAIFTINLKIAKNNNQNDVITSKFHLVDLAGSERQKKTCSTGERFREGININKGLLVLGKVISDLCEGHDFVNYRDSKLTRLLQDSLGGNSVTLMIACVSPADYNQDETLSTLRYADRALKIKNKPIINQNPLEAELAKLRKENEELRLQFVNQDGSSCPPEHKHLAVEVENLNKRNVELSRALNLAIIENMNSFERILINENKNEDFKEKLNELCVLSESVISENVNEGDLKPLKDKIMEIKKQNKINNELVINSLNTATGYHIDNEDAIPLSTQDQILYRAKINNKIQEISNQIIYKENLYAKYIDNSSNWKKLDENSEKIVKEMEEQITALQKEKNELLDQLKKKENSDKSTANSEKISKERRLKIQELDKQISALKAKVQEQDRLIKMKSHSEEKIKALKVDIDSMKQHKVKLIQQLKFENDKFRLYKAEKDRELISLRNDNNKKRITILRMERKHAQQQSILKRKLEAAAAINKRMKDIFEKQAAYREKRNNKDISIEKIIEERINTEVEFAQWIYDAETSLETLFQHRATLTKEISALNNKLQEELSQKERTQITSDISELKKQCEMRSCQIADLKQKIVDYKVDETPRIDVTREIHSMNQAKAAISYLFNLTTELKKDYYIVSQNCTDYKEEYEAALARIEDYEKEYDNVVKEKKIELDKKDVVHENQIYQIVNSIQTYQTGNNNNKCENEELNKCVADLLENLDTIRKLRNKVEKLVVHNNELEVAIKKCDHCKSSPTVFSPITPEKRIPTSHADTPFFKRFDYLKRKNTSCNCTDGCLSKKCICKLLSYDCDQCQCTDDGNGLCKNRTSNNENCPPNNESSGHPPPKKIKRFILDNEDDKLENSSVENQTEIKEKSSLSYFSDLV